MILITIQLQIYFKIHIFQLCLILVHNVTQYHFLMFIYNYQNGTYFYIRIAIISLFIDTYHHVILSHNCTTLFQNAHFSIAHLCLIL